MERVTFQGTGFENRVSAGACIQLSVLALVVATVRTVSNRKSVSSVRGTGISSKHRGGGGFCLQYDSYRNSMHKIPLRLYMSPGMEVSCKCGE
jgi:hypothetical protein